MTGRQDESRWAVRWLGAPVDRLSSERRRELVEAAAMRGRLSSRGALARLREVAQAAREGQGVSAVPAGRR
jgi:hypothetical protein